jgi:steroid delta-isomerase-like uncharacterized protein
MAEQKLVTIARQMIDAFNAGDRERFKKHVTAEAVYDEVGTQRQLHGAEAWVQAWEEWRRALPDVKGTINNVVAAGNTVVLEITWDGTHSGALNLPGNTIPPSGKRQITRATQVLIFDGEKVKECRHYFDMLGLLQQIGAAPRLTRAAG